MVKRSALIAREGGERDSSLCVIAVEGQKTEPAYFESLKRTGVVDHARTSVVVIPSEQGRSDPAGVLLNLKAARRSIHGVQRDDRFWLVVDWDRWRDRKLARIAKECRAGVAGLPWGLAVSNPCFEIWLQLHFVDRPVLDDRGPKQALHDLRQVHAPGEDAPWTRERVGRAIERARDGDPNPRARWPHGVGTRVYRVFGDIALTGRPT